MRQRKIVVPEGMLKAAEAGIECGGAPWVNAVLQTALLWLSDNPISPSDKQCDVLLESFALDGELRRGGPVNRAQVKCLVTAWQRRMLIDQEKDVPIEVRDLILPTFFNALQVATGEVCTRTEEKYKDAVIEAYHRGQKAGSR